MSLVRIVGTDCSYYPDFPSKNILSDCCRLIGMRICTIIIFNYSRFKILTKQIGLFVVYLSYEHSLHVMLHCICLINNWFLSKFLAFIQYPGCCIMFVSCLFVRSFIIFVVMS